MRIVPQGSAGGKGVGVRHLQAIFLVICGLTPAALNGEARIGDPAAFVSKVYRKLTASSRGAYYDPPDDIYTPRLKALFEEDDRRAHGEVGCIDFSFWVNGQDYEIKKVHVVSSGTAASPDRKLVVATFLNFGDPTEIHFDFQRMGGRWLLDDVHGVKPGTPWTVSEILKCSIP